MVNILTAILTTIVLIVAWTAQGLIAPVVTLTENQTLYIFSTQSQVIAAVYGLIITGYIFLRNQQDRLSDRDETLVEILKDIQSRQYKFVMFITASALASILVSLLAIAYRESPIAVVRLLPLNAASALFFSSLMWTGFFVIDAMDPEEITRASERIKSRVEDQSSRSTDQGGSLEDFLTNFNSIEKILVDFASHHLDKYAIYQGKNTRTNWSKPRIVQTMSSFHIIPHTLGEELVALIRYRNALVHGQDMNVSREVVERLKAAKVELENCLQRDETRDRGEDEETQAAGSYT